MQIRFLKRILFLGSNGTGEQRQEQTWENQGFHAKPFREAVSRWKIANFIF
jgi:hypothetical protein